MCIYKNHRGELFGSGHTVYSVDLKTKHISAAGVPGNRLALAYVAEEMMFIAGGELLDGESDIFSFGSEGGYAAEGEYEDQQGGTSLTQLGVFHS